MKEGSCLEMRNEVKPEDPHLGCKLVRQKRRECSSVCTTAEGGLSKDLERKRAAHTADGPRTEAFRLFQVL